MQLRSDAIKRGLARAPHRSLLKADGLTDEEMDRPLVAVVSAQNEVIPGHIHLQQIADAVKAGVRMAGGTPMQVNTIGVCDGIAMNHEGMHFSLTSREVIADSVECVVQGHQFDAMVLIPSCDKIVPGMLIAACRLNIPTVLVSGGPMLAGRGRNGEQTDLNSLFDAVGQVTAGTMTPEECAWLENTACPTCGSCSGMFTANSICCLAEALGLALPGNGTVPAVYSERIRLAKRAGMKVMELLEKNICIRDIITPAAIHNAMECDMAFGGSTNTVLHLTAIAMEAGCPITMDDWDAASARSCRRASRDPSATGNKPSCARCQPLGSRPHSKHNLGSAGAKDPSSLTRAPACYGPRGRSRQSKLVSLPAPSRAMPPRARSRFYLNPTPPRSMPRD